MGKIEPVVVAVSRLRNRRVSVFGGDAVHDHAVYIQFERYGNRMLSRMTEGGRIVQMRGRDRRPEVGR